MLSARRAMSALGAVRRVRPGPAPRARSSLLQSRPHSSVGTFPVAAPQLRGVFVAAGAGLCCAAVATMTASFATPSTFCEPLMEMHLLDGIPAGDLQRFDQYYDQRGVNGNLSQCLVELQECYTRSTSTAERADLCWRLARCCYNLANTTDPSEKDTYGTKEKQRELADQALKYAHEALQVAPEDFRSHYWVGIAIQEVGKHEGTKYTIKHLNDIRAYFERATELNPRDGTSLYCLGAWCYELANLGWVQRQVASAVFASPPTSTFAEARDFFLRAEEAEPEFWIKNVVMLAKAYEKLGDKAQAAEWAEVASRRLVLNPEDENAAAEARSVLARVSK